MGRILLLVLTMMLTAPFAAEAQRTSEVRRIGYLQADVSGLSGFYDILRQGLRDLGYEEGRNLVIEYRSGENRARLVELAAELVRAKGRGHRDAGRSDLGRPASHGDDSDRVLVQR